MDELSSSTKSIGPGWAKHVQELVLKIASEIVSTNGLRDYWVDDPHRPYPECPAVPFEPRYIAILYLGLEDDWSIDVNHACYELPPTATTPDARRDWAIDILEEKLKQGETLGNAVLADHPPYEHTKPIWEFPERTRDSGLLREFKFASPNEIFIFLDKKACDVSLHGKRLIGFKALGAHDDGLRLPNDTFYNARAVPDDEMGALLGKGHLIRIENYATGVSNSTEPLVYSMDIKFQIKAGDGEVTMVVDPDTGNGTGNEP